MDKELAILEQKLEQLIQLVGVLRGENASMRERIAGLEVENRRLSSKVELAATRIESVLALLPEEIVES